LALLVNQAYFGFAGDRISTAAVGRELWAKPLGNRSAAAVLFNRNGTTFKCVAAAPIDAPCDDVPAATTGAQRLRLDFGQLARWVAPPGTPAGAPLRCSVTDVYGGGADAGRAAPLGVFANSFERTVAPHGVAFLLIGNCTVQG